MTDIKDKEVCNMTCGICKSSNQFVFQFAVGARSCICIPCLVDHPDMELTKSDLEYLWRLSRMRRYKGFQDRVYNAIVPTELRRFIDYVYTEEDLMRDI